MLFGHVRRFSSFWTLGERLPIPSRTAEILRLPENLGDSGLLKTTVIKLCSDENKEEIKTDTYASLLRQCAALKALLPGQLLHQHIVKRKFDGDTYLGNLIVQMYGGCGDVDSARKAYDRIKSPNVFSGNVMLAAYAQNGHLLEAREIFDHMPDPNVVSWNSMVAAYAQHGDVYEAKKIFDRIPEPNVVSWNSMIAGYAQNGFSQQALQLFKLMDLHGVEPNKLSFVSAVDAAGNLAALEDGNVIYEKVVEKSYEADTAVGTALINMFGKCGMLAKAKEIFYNKALQRNAVTWTSIVSVYAHHGQLEDAKRFFDSVPRPSVVTWNVLMAAYTQHGLVDEVQRIFDRMKQKDDVSWSTLVGAYAQNGQPRLAMDLFKEMDLEGHRPTKFTFMNVVDACGRLSALREGRIVHSCISSTAFRWDPVLQNGIINMYGRCGSLDEVRQAFDQMRQQRDSVSWSIVISALAHNGHGSEALGRFLEMNLEGAAPDEITMVSILSVCAHSGLSKDARARFLDMNRDYHLQPSADHYVCMVDVLCRAGLLADAEELIQTMPFHPHVAAWTTLLGACKTLGDLKRAAAVGKAALALDPPTSAPYALLSNVYADAKRVNEVRIVRKAMEERGLKKQAGCSYIEVYDRIHEFRAGESQHPKQREIVYELIQLMGRMSAAGYVPDTKLVNWDLEEEDKETVLSYHSEKLAIGLGLLSTKPGTPLRVVKNLRVCSDCHAAIKFISKVTQRRIVVRDCNRFHHFEWGKCSCDDYW